MKNILIILIVFLTTFVFSQTEKDSFSVVFIQKTEFVNIYKSYSENSEILGKIPAGISGIISTWKTYYFNDEFWVEIIYGEKKGYIKRKYITRGFDEITAQDIGQLDKILMKMTTSLQKKDSFNFKDLIYSLRGIAFYDSKDQTMFRYERKEINPMFVNLSDNSSFESIFLNKSLNILESNFFIQYNSSQIRNSLPVELDNFQFISLANDADDYILCIGFEKWSNILYISYLAILNK
jgi:hypothetical protein